MAMVDPSDKSVLRLELKWMIDKILNGEKRQLTAEEQRQIELWSERRKEGEPLAYILGEKGFYKSIFSVGPGVLIPRPETEFIVETAIELFTGQEPTCFVEFGFGSGCIGLSLLKEWSATKLIAIEKSPEATHWAQKNILKFGLEKRTVLLTQDVQNFDLIDYSSEKIMLVVSNPPYIAESDINVEVNVKKYEPHHALFSGTSGLDSLSSWSDKAFQILEPLGYWIFEFGSGQTKDVCAIISQRGFDLKKIVQDYAGHDRVVVAQKNRK